jgi:hypothetical protein
MIKDMHQTYVVLATSVSGPRDKCPLIQVVGTSDGFFLEREEILQCLYD